PPIRDRMIFHPNPNPNPNPKIRIYVRLECSLETSSFRLSIRTESATITTGMASLIVDVLGVFSSLVQE
ncbi:MAG: hypothetical protein Q8P67_14380, partial [archaeon]|nr:hypothetical protein [archaeon]